ncbi:MAG TPA: PAS domain-containing protein [Xanthobacteraceae bacterium]|nr:PAS domain-containing protein [Xanthobacteraceae bacterium]
MKHAASRELHAYWEERRGKRAAPERADIEPGAIRRVLSDAFMLALDGGAGHPFRLAGTRVCALFGRELKGEPFIGLWAAASQPVVSDLLAILSDERVGTIAGVAAQSADGEPIDLELLLLPLAAGRPSLARGIGILAPLKTPQWLGASAVGALTLGSRRHVGASVEGRLLPRFMAPRRRLIVHEGGRGLGG